MGEEVNDTENRKKTIEHLQPYQFRKGQSGNPGGRPSGKSLKMYSREMLAAMDEEERQDFLHGIPKIEIYKMAEGNPDNKTDLTTKGEKIEFTGKSAEIAKEFEEKLKKTL